MGGIYLSQQLSKDGHAVSKVTDLVYLPIDDLSFAPKGAPLWHPRSEDPIDEDLVGKLMAGFDSNKPITVRDEGIVNGRHVFTIIDGARRKVNGTESQIRLRAKDSKILRDGVYKVAVRFFDGDDLACLKERERLQSETDKKPHSASVLAASYKAMEKLGATPEEIAAECAPRGVTAEIVAALLRWEAINREVQQRLDTGEAPLSVLPAVLVVPRADQPAFLDDIIKNKATTPRKAKKAAREKTGVPSKAPPFRLPTPRTFNAMRNVVPENALVSARALLDFLAGDKAGLATSAPQLAARLDDAYTTASKPGGPRKSKTAAE